MLSAKNVVYQFRCLCDTNLAYVGMTTRHLAARACEHLVLAGPQKSAIKEHILACVICREEKYTVNSFQILKVAILNMKLKSKKLC